MTLTHELVRMTKLDRHQTGPQQNNRAFLLSIDWLAVSFYKKFHIFASIPYLFEPITVPSSIAMLQFFLHTGFSECSGNKQIVTSGFIWGAGWIGQVIIEISIPLNMIK